MSNLPKKTPVYKLPEEERKKLEHEYYKTRQARFKPDYEEKKDESFTMKLRNMPEKEESKMRLRSTTVKKADVKNIHIWPIIRGRRENVRKSNGRRMKTISVNEVQDEGIEDAETNRVEMEKEENENTEVGMHNLEVEVKIDGNMDGPAQKSDENMMDTSEQPDLPQSLDNENVLPAVDEKNESIKQNVEDEQQTDWKMDTDEFSEQMEAEGPAEPQIDGNETDSSKNETPSVDGKCDTMELNSNQTDRIQNDEKTVPSMDDTDEYAEQMEVDKLILPQLGGNETDGLKNESPSDDGKSDTMELNANQTDRSKDEEKVDANMDGPRHDSDENMMDTLEQSDLPQLLENGQNGDATLDQSFQQVALSMTSDDFLKFSLYPKQFFVGNMELMLEKDKPVQFCVNEHNQLSFSFTTACHEERHIPQQQISIPLTEVESLKLKRENTDRNPAGFILNLREEEAESALSKLGTVSQLIQEAKSIPLGNILIKAERFITVIIQEDELEGEKKEEKEIYMRAELGSGSSQKTLNLDDDETIDLMEKEISKRSMQCSSSEDGEAKKIEIAIINMCDWNDHMNSLRLKMLKDDSTYFYMDPKVLPVEPKKKFRKACFDTEENVKEARERIAASKKKEQMTNGKMDEVNCVEPLEHKEHNN